MKLSQILEGGKRLSELSDEYLAKALRTSVEEVRKDRAAAEDYYSDKASEYAMDAAGAEAYDEEEEAGEKCIRCRKGTMQPGETMMGPAKKCDRCGYQLARKEGEEDEEANLIGKLIADLSMAAHEGGKKLTDVVKDLEQQYYRDAEGKEEQLRSMQ